MSIQTEITRLNTAKANILTSISNKGVDTSSVNTLNDIPPLIDSITGGTGSGGDYNIAVTIDGNTQELAITDADGGSGGNEPQNIFTNDYSQIGYAGTYIKSNGYTTDGILWSDLTPYTGQNATWYVTNPIPIKANTWYKYEGFSSGNNPGACFLGADQTTIYDGFVYKYNGNFKTPSEARYIVMTVNKPYLETMIIREMTELEITQMEIDSLLMRTITTYSNDRITSVGSSAFRSASFTSVSLANVTIINGYGLDGCSNLTDVYAPKVTQLNNYAFQGCTALKKLDFPLKITTQGSVFARSGLETLILRGETMSGLGNANSFTSTPIASGTGYIYVPRALIDTYKANTNWSTYSNQFRAIEDYPDICGGVV